MMPWRSPTVLIWLACDRSAASGGLFQSVVATRVSASLPEIGSGVELTAEPAPPPFGLSPSTSRLSQALATSVHDATRKGAADRTERLVIMMSVCARTVQAYRLSSVGS